MQPEEQKLIVRLRSAEGHLRAIIGMIETGRPCEDVIYQLIAVQAALRAASLVVLKRQLQFSAAVIRSDPRPETRCAELQQLLALYTLLNKHIA
jgi:DNA-binding FrmR family transcriptional regulator